MRHHLLAGAIALGLMSFAQGATARDLPDGGMTIQEVAAWLQDAGYKAEIATNDKGKQYIKSAAEGAGFNIDMYDCHDGPRCGSMELAAGFDLTNGMSFEKINEWNRDNRYIKGYLDTENDPYAEYEVNLSPGRTYESLNDDFAIWRTALPKFKTFIGW